MAPQLVEGSSCSRLKMDSVHGVLFQSNVTQTQDIL